MPINSHFKNEKLSTFILASFTSPCKVLCNINQKHATQRMVFYNTPDLKLEHKLDPNTLVWKRKIMPYFFNNYVFFYNRE